MPENRWSAHIGYLFTELPLCGRIAAAAEAGFTAIEHPQPFAIPAAEMRAELARHRLVISQMAAAVGDASIGEKGLAAIPGREADCREQFDRALDYAVAISCPFVHPMAGVQSKSIPSKTTVDSAAFLPRWKQFMAANANPELKDRRPA